MSSGLRRVRPNDGDRLVMKAVTLSESHLGGAFRVAAVIGCSFSCVLPSCHPASLAPGLGERGCISLLLKRQGIVKMPEMRAAFESRRAGQHIVILRCRERCTGTRSSAGLSVGGPRPCCWQG